MQQNLIKQRPSLLKQTRFIGLTAITGAFILSLFSTSAHATVVQKANLEDLNKISEVVIHGIIRDIDPNLAANDKGPYRTRIQIEIIESIKGLKTEERTLTLEIPGGRNGKLVMRIPGMPRFAMGDEVVLLLERTGPGQLIYAGFSQGVYYVDRSAEEIFVKQRLGGSHFVDKKGGDLHKEPELIRPLALRSLLENLRQLAKNGGEQ
ncbi:hypothetical protein KAI87_11770 [Myxococcota bacterium]|nr:hypothetical protein [Myxococcota bacterium]